MLPGVLLALFLELGEEVPAGSLQGRVAEGIIVVAHAVRLRGLGGVAVLDERVVEGVVPGLDELGAELVGGHPVDAVRVVRADSAVVRIGVFLAPEAVQARSDVADARVPVVAFAEGCDEVQEHLLHVRVVVVGGERLLLVAVEVVRAARVRAAVDEVLGQRRGLARGVDVEADDALVSARRDGVEHGVDRGEVVGVAAGDDVLEREGRPFERVRQRSLSEDGLAAGGGRPRHEALHRVRHRGRCRREGRPLGCGGRRGRGRQGGSRQSDGGRQGDGDASNCPHREGPFSLCCGWGRGAVWARRVESERVASQRYAIRVSAAVKLSITASARARFATIVRVTACVTSVATGWTGARSEGASARARPERARWPRSAAIGPRQRSRRRGCRHHLR